MQLPSMRQKSTSSNLRLLEDGPIAKYTCQRTELADEKMELARSLKKYGGIVFGLGSSLTAIERRNRQARIAQINLIDGGLKRAQRALELGYQLAEPPSQLWLGRYWQTKPFTKALELRNPAVMEYKWRKPLPLPILDAFDRAKSSGCFDAIVIGSTNKADVEVVSPLENQPVMLGLIITAANYEVYFGGKPGEGWNSRPQNKVSGVELFTIFGDQSMKNEQKK